MEDSKASDAVLRIFTPPEGTNDVLDVGGIEEFKATIFCERNIAPRQLDFKLGAVARYSEKDSLLFERNAGFPRLNDLLSNMPRLRPFVGDSCKVRLLFRLPLRKQVFGVPILGKADDPVRGLKYRLCGPVIFLKGNDSSLRVTLIGKIF